MLLWNILIWNWSWSCEWIHLWIHRPGCTIPVQRLVDSKFNMRTYCKWVLNLSIICPGVVLKNHSTEKLLAKETTQLSKTNSHYYYFLNNFKYHLQIHKKRSLKEKWTVLPDYIKGFEMLNRQLFNYFWTYSTLTLMKSKHASADCKTQLERVQQLDFFIWLVRTLIVLYPHPPK